MRKLVLAGDVGGTKTNLAVYSVGAEGDLEVERQDSFRSREHDGLGELVEGFLGDERGAIAAAVFGVAGPVLGDVVKPTNLPWTVDAKQIGARIGCSRVRLMNDLAATAYGTLFLPSGKLQVLNEGVQRRGNRAVIAAGTGLGQAIILWDGVRFHPVATEGGHADFAPRNEVEIRLLSFLLRDHERVSFERVLSGPGLSEIFRFVTSECKVPAAVTVLERMREGDPSSVIGTAGVEGTCEASRKAVDIFVSIYGAQAGNLALSTLALGGVYVAGGIVTKLLPRIAPGAFMDAFKAKEPFTDLMAQIPVHVVLDPGASHLGAAHVAAELASGTG